MSSGDALPPGIYEIDGGVVVVCAICGMENPFPHYPQGKKLCSNVDDPRYGEHELPLR